MVFQVTQNNKRNELLRYLQSDTTGLAGLSQFKVTLIGDSRAFGTFKNDPFRLRSGVALSTGRVADLPGINTADGRNTYTGGSVKDSFKDLSTDFALNGSDGDDIKLQIQFYADDSKDSLYFQYAFGSEEFKEYAGSSYNDRFSLTLNGINYAYLLNGKLVTINNLLYAPIDSGDPYYINNPVGTGPASSQTRLDGYTVPLLFTAPLKKNAINTLIIEVQDFGDGQYDSAVFIKAGTFGTRRPPDIPLTDQDGSLDSGTGGNKLFDIDSIDSVVTLTNFGGVGRGAYPTLEIIAEVDTLRFTGAGLTAQNMLLNHNGTNLEIRFDGIATPQVVLQDFALENLDNLRQKTGASIDIGNILFNGDTEIQDSFDVFNAEWQNGNPDWNTGHIMNCNTVTFLNDLDNDIAGFDNSDDVINGQGGNDILSGLGGNDILRGGTGNDTLSGGAGNNILTGNEGADVFVISLNSTSTVTDFTLGQDLIGISAGLTTSQLKIEQGTGIDASNTWVKLANNDSLLLTLKGVKAADLTTAAFLPDSGYQGSLFV
jgi:Ca2+-binding RTX toxin-like protein